MSDTDVPTVDGLGQALGHTPLDGMIMHALNDATGLTGRHASPTPQPPPPLGSWLLQMRPVVVVRDGKADLEAQPFVAASGALFAATWTSKLAA